VAGSPPVRQLPCVLVPQTEKPMPAIAFKGAVLAALMLVYSVSPVAAWLALAATGALVIAKRSRPAEQVSEGR
jgi:hypothetical protein